MNKRAIQVLVVDDENAVLESLAAYLNDYGYQVTTAVSAEEALVLARLVQPAVAIVDLRLPAMDGEALIRELHADYPVMQFLIHTGSVGYEPPPALRACGVAPARVLFKPQLDLGAFVRAIEQVLSEAGRDAIDC